MRIIFSYGGGVSLVHVSRLDKTILYNLASFDPDSHPAARERLFQSISRAEDPEADIEWEELVHDDIRAGFALARETVCEDLKTLRPMLESEDGSPRLYSMHIPGDHIDAWISTLNQGRLAIHAVFGNSLLAERENMVPNPFGHPPVGLLPVPRMIDLAYVIAGSFLDILVDLQLGDRGRGGNGDSEDEAPRDGEQP
jgi:hypothetical protein